jgi:hypothetical protein
LNLSKYGNNTTNNEIGKYAGLAIFVLGIMLLIPSFIFIMFIMIAGMISNIF